MFSCVYSPIVITCLAWFFNYIIDKNSYAGRSICPTAAVCTVVEILIIKCIGVTTLTFQGHVTSSVTWPIDSHYAVFYSWSVDTFLLSRTVTEIFWWTGYISDINLYALYKSTFCLLTYTVLSYFDTERLVTAVRRCMNFEPLQLGDGRRLISTLMLPSKTHNRGPNLGLNGVNNWGATYWTLKVPQITEHPLHNHTV